MVDENELKKYMKSPSKVEPIPPVFAYVTGFK